MGIKTKNFEKQYQLFDRMSFSVPNFMPLFLYNGKFIQYNEIKAKCTSDDADAMYPCIGIVTTQ